MRAPPAGAEQDRRRRVRPQEVQTQVPCHKGHEGLLRVQDAGLQERPDNTLPHGGGNRRRGHNQAHRRPCGGGDSPACRAN